MPKERKQAQVRLLTEEGGSERLTNFSQRILADAAFRDAFLSDPAAALRDSGVDAGDVKLSDRDRALIQLIGDEKISGLYKERRFVDLQRYLTDRYSELVVVRPGDVEFAVADFDVLIEAEAVAVAVVAVAAIVIGAIERPGDIVFERVNQLEAVLQARIVSLEARLATLESKIR